MRLSLGFLSLLALAVSAQDTSIKTVKQAFDNAHIPADLTLKFDPTALLEVTFPEADGHPITLHAGVQLPRDATAGPPSFRALGTSFRGPFVVAAVDPDALTPQMPTEAQTRHFLGGNFFLRLSTGLLSNSTPAISEFFQPSPPAGSDAHRYIFLLFKQPPGFNQQTFITPTTSISRFNISVFADEVGMGDPVAGTYMLVAPDA